MKWTKWAPVMVLAGMVASCDQAGPVDPVSPSFTHDPVDPTALAAYVEEAWSAR